jgi:hypothetical protein
MKYLEFSYKHQYLKQSRARVQRTKTEIDD